MDMNGIPNVAEAFQKAGITALVYDPRSVGFSDGEPRNDVDPYKQIEDYFDAITCLSNLPGVDKNRIAIWGISLSAAVALCVTAHDPRVKAAIAICPALQYTYDPQKITKVVAKCIQDRESQVKGNPPLYVPMLDKTGDNPAGFQLGYEREKAVKFLESGVELAPNFVNRTTIQSYHRLLRWRPATIFEGLKDTPVLFIVPENDKLCPADVQIQHYAALQCPKTCFVEKGKGHMDVLDGESFQRLMDLQLEFVQNTFGSPTP
jgi:pimeloyl-ACP methyl ester carboxylesterase